MINSVKRCTEVQQNQNCGSAAVCIYVDVIENFDEGSLSAVMGTEIKLKMI